MEERNFRFNILKDLYSGLPIYQSANETSSLAKIIAPNLIEIAHFIGRLKEVTLKPNQEDEP